MGCVCVSILVALAKDGGWLVEDDVERAVMEDRASWWKGRMERSIESRAALAWMRVIRVWEEEEVVVEEAIVIRMGMMWKIGRWNCMVSVGVDPMESMGNVLMNANFGLLTYGESRMSSRRGVLGPGK